MVGMACPSAASCSVVILINPYPCRALLLDQDEGVLDFAKSSSRQDALAEGLRSPKEVVLSAEQKVVLVMQLLK